MNTEDDHIIEIGPLDKEASISRLKRMRDEVTSRYEFMDESDDADEMLYEIDKKIRLLENGGLPK